LGKIRIGTASWTDRSLIESRRFYPDSATSAEARLRYYASQFPLVEVDSTYYGMPSERNSHRIYRFGKGNIRSIRLGPEMDSLS